MFPCKLLEVQLSPLPKRNSCRSIFLEDLSLERNHLANLLEEDGKQLREGPAQQLVDLCQAEFQPDQSPVSFQRQLHNVIDTASDVPLQLLQRKNNFMMDDLTLLMMISFVYQRKIVVYFEKDNLLQSQVINFGFKHKMYLSRQDDKYRWITPVNGESKRQSIKKSLPQESDDAITTIASEIWSSTNSKKLTFSSNKYEDDESDSIIRDCNLFVNNEASTSVSDSKKSESQQDDFFTPPKSSKPTNLSQSLEEPRPKNDLLASLNISAPNQRHTGKLKFYDEQKSYGFIVMDVDGSDIFVHSDDLLKAGVPKELLKSSKQGLIIRLQFSFTCLNYIGKYKKSRKAVDLTLIQPTIYPAQQYVPFYNQIPFGEINTKNFPPFMENIHHRNLNFTS